MNNLNLIVTAEFSVDLVFLLPTLTGFTSDHIQLLSSSCYISSSVQDTEKLTKMHKSDDRQSERSTISRQM